MSDWSLSNEKDYLKRIGEIFLVDCGIERCAVAVAEIHCGYYKYDPILQSRLFRLYLATAGIEQIATNLAANYPGPFAKADAKNLMRRIKEACDECGLTEYLNQAKRVSGLFVKTAKV